MLLIHIDFRENRDNQFDLPLTGCIGELFTVLFSGNLRDPSSFPLSTHTDQIPREHCRPATLPHFLDALLNRK